MTDDKGFRMELFDMHCHLDFAGNREELARCGDADGIGFLSMTVTPDGYGRAVRELSPFSNVWVALGLHPWWVNDARRVAEDVASFTRSVEDVPYIGEIGLDFGKRHAGTRDVQLEAFDRIIQACGTGGKVISLHAVEAAGTVLDVLELHACTKVNSCVFHWFSGSSDDLQRAVGMGCYFSISRKMLRSKRGRAYAKAIPVDRLLLETDEPSEPTSIHPYPALESDLRGALAELEHIRGTGLARRIAQTSGKLIG